MDLILISASNRKGNRTRDVTGFYQQILTEKKHSVKLLDLQEIESQMLVEAATGKRVAGIQALNEQYLTDAEKILVVVPEYNGSIPGIFKLFIDAVHPEIWAGKKAALVGISSGRSGNMRGLDHLTAIFNYLQVEVLSYKLNIPAVRNVLDEGIENDVALTSRMTKQILLLEKF
jgi:chromate reductase, NAD(P)H dehydrogenase (quinone)